MVEPMRKQQTQQRNETSDPGEQHSGPIPAIPNSLEIDESQEMSWNPDLVYEASTWSIVEESSLSSNVVTQFECLLTIEGTNYEIRQSLALQRGK